MGVDALVCALAVMSLGGMAKYFDSRILQNLALLPSEDYFTTVGLLLAVLYLSLAWNYFELAGILDLPTLGLTVGWVGFSWLMIAWQLRSPEAAEHVLSWTGNHLLLTGCFYSLLGIKTLLL